MAPQDEIDSLQNEAKMAKLSSNREMDQKTIESFDTADKLTQITGKKEGEIRVFRHGMVPKAYMWKSGKWELIGDVMGGEEKPKTSYYQGDRYFPAGDYDYIFNVQDDSGANKRLPFNIGDNSLVAAEKFLNREGMNVGFKEQIIGFITQNTKGKVGARPRKTAGPKKPKVEKLQAFREKTYWRKMNLDGLEKKLIELNLVLREEGDDAALTDHELKHFKTLLVKLRDPKIYNYIKEFSSFEKLVIEKVIKWPGKVFIPVMDLMRIFVVHHATQAFFSGLDSGIHIFVAIASKLTHAPKVIWKLYFKFLCNMCMHDNNSIGLVKASEIIFNSFSFLDLKNSKLLTLVADFFMTISSDFDVILTADEKLAGKYVNAVAGFFAGGDINEEGVLKFSIAVVNFAILKPGCRGSGLDSLGKVLVERLQGVKNKVKNRLINNLKQVCNGV